MIELPTRRRLERRRDRLYEHLHSILHNASVIQVENIMRQIHAINLKLRIYFKGGIDRQPQELFINPNEDNDITTQDTATGEIAPTLQDIAEIEQQIKEGKI
jgi:hypothetical protein